jgi:hypothetical protein
MTQSATTAHQATATAKREARALFATYGIAVPARDVQATATTVRVWLPTEARAAALAVPGVVQSDTISAFFYISRETLAIVREV